MFPDGVSYLPRGSPGNLQKFSTTILRDFICGTHPLTRALTSCLWCIFARAPMVMKYRGTLTRCSVSLICIKREQAWFSAEWFNLGIKAGCGNKRFVSLASEQHPFPLSLFLCPRIVFPKFVICRPPLPSPWSRPSFSIASYLALNYGH